MRRFRNIILRILRDLIEAFSPSPSSPISWRGQGMMNQRGNALGCIRSAFCIERPGLTTVVKVDRSGGEAHLLNYWKQVEQNVFAPNQDFLLIYVFIAPSWTKFQAQQNSWDFCLQKARLSLGNRFNAVRVTCLRPPTLDCHANVTEEFIKYYSKELEEQGILDQFRQLLAKSMSAFPKRFELLPTTRTGQK